MHLLNVSAPSCPKESVSFPKKNTNTGNATPQMRAERVPMTNIHLSAPERNWNSCPYVHILGLGAAGAACFFSSSISI
jgi:hypothetical protein